LTKTRVYLVTAIVLIQFIIACGGDQAGKTQDGAPVVVVTVNAEEQYVELRNNQDSVHDLSGWYLSLGRRLTCHLGEDVQIQPGETLRIWALAQDAGREGYNCGLDRPFWSDKEPQRVFLYRADGQVVDSYFGGEE
jgi:hypothetical protein